jgi:hypothetical protein
MGPIGRVVMAGGAAVVFGALAAAGGLASTGSSTVPSPEADASVPPTWLALTRSAAATCPGLDWSLLAGVAEVESGFGTSALPGVSSGANSAGAEGPMQFEPATFAAYNHPTATDPAPTPGGAIPPDPYDPSDAVYAAARYLCSLDVGTDATAAIVAYNCGSVSPACRLASGPYAAEVLAFASRVGVPSATVAGSVASAVVAAARSVMGAAYLWAGDSPTAGFDCSGLAAWAYARAGIALPHNAQAQLDLGPTVPADRLAAGDLVFFGAGAGAVDHVGIYVGDGEMIDAPHSGGDVRLDFIDGFTPPYVGATRPEAGP